jgi:GNAT superfamily N-acetyltransferase
MSGRVWDFDDDEKEFDLASFKIYHCDVHRCFELGCEPVFMLEHSWSDIDCLRSYLEPGDVIQNFIYIEEFHVQPQYRRQGITRCVVEHIGRLWSQLPLVLKAFPQHDIHDKYTPEDLEKCYETLGFKRIPGIDTSEHLLMMRDAVDQYLFE